MVYRKLVSRSQIAFFRLFVGAEKESGDMVSTSLRSTAICKVLASET